MESDQGTKKDRSCRFTAVVASERILYTPSAFARSALMHLQEIGQLHALKPHTSSRDNLQSYLFFLVQDGEGKLEYVGKSYFLHAGDCVFIDCRRPYSHSTEEKLWTLQWCHFSGPSMASIYEKYLERGGQPAFSPAEATREALAETWKQLMTVAESTDYMRDMLINQHLSALMTALMSESWHPETKRPAPRRASVLEIKEYLDGHYAERLTLDELAERFYMNKFYLTHTFKEQIGQTISAYLQAVRITRAKQMLRFSAESMESIANACGFSTPAYFSRVFREVEGIAPSVYREKW